VLVDREVCMGLLLERASTHAVTELRDDRRDRDAGCEVEHGAGNQLLLSLGSGADHDPGCEAAEDVGGELKDG
jgi:hypothetical protein